MIDRLSLTLAVGHLGEDRAPRGGGSRRRSKRAPAHEWVDRAGGGRVCRWCAMQDGAEWHGAAMGCGNAHAKNMASKKKIAESGRPFRVRGGENEEARAGCNSTGLGTETEKESRCR